MLTTGLFLLRSSSAGPNCRSPAAASSVRHSETALASDTSLRLSSALLQHHIFTTLLVSESGGKRRKKP